MVYKAVKSDTRYTICITENNVENETTRAAAYILVKKLDIMNSMTKLYFASMKFNQK